MGSDPVTPVPPPADETGPRCCERCGETPAQYVRDPYAWDVNDELIYGWWCDQCLQERSDDI